MSDAVTALEAEYCPPIDPALFSAILSDFDLSQDGSVDAAREILESLRVAALSEENTAFDPSGSSGVYKDIDTDLRSAPSDHSDHNASARQSDGTDPSSLSSGLRSLDLSNASEGDVEQASPNAFLDAVERLDDASKMVLLSEMFPDISAYTITFTLKKCNGKWDRAIEELLNQSFFEGEGLVDGTVKVPAKGVEAFSEDNIARRGRRKKDKRRAKMLDEEEKRSSSVPSNPGSNTNNLWNAGLKDVEFIASRTKTASATISSLYHQNGASLPATITALLNSPSLLSSTSAPPLGNPVLQVHAYELGQDFPSISPEHLISLLRLTHPSTAAAHELARALTTRKPGTSGGLHVITRYAPIQSSSNNTSEDEGGWTSARSSRQTPSTTPISISPHIISPAVLAASYNAAASHAFTQASAAYRRGKSDKLMGAAAGYYSQVGRDFAMLRADATSDAADALVAAQSTSRHVDLHGVSVKDAVRIAKSRTEAWWRAGGGRGVMGLDGRVSGRGTANGISGGLSLITGVGRHSEGGRAKIGPAVGRMLAQEGWRFIVEEGVLTVTGKSN